MWYPQGMPFAELRVGVDISRRAWLNAMLGLTCAAACNSKQPETADGTLLSPYLAIGQTLSDDELDNLATYGAQIVSAAETVSDQPGIADVLAAAGRLGAADIATARLAYRKLSDGMIAWLAAHPEQREGLLLVHCPMAFTNEGAYWVQPRGQLRNPYEGAMMLRCGADVAWDDYRRGAPPAGEAKLEGMP
jgi:Cu(I)/Ag(I) efflux system membrane fusion protein